jgi:hypothetical protein
MRVFRVRLESLIDSAESVVDPAVTGLSLCQARQKTKDAHPCTNASHTRKPLTDERYSFARAAECRTRPPQIVASQMDAVRKTMLLRNGYNFRSRRRRAPRFSEPSGIERYGLRRQDR